MSGLNGPQTQATGFNFSHSQLDSQPNYSFADLTQDGNAYSDFPEFSGLTQVNRSVLLQGHSDCLSPNAPVHSCRSPDNTVFAWTHLSKQRQTLGLAYSVQLLTLLCCRTQPLKLPGMMLYKHLHWYGSKRFCLSVTPIGHDPYLTCCSAHRQLRLWMGQRLQASAVASHQG